MVTSPHNRNITVGAVDWAAEETVETALACAFSAYPTWQECSIQERGKYLLSLADKLEMHTPELVALCHREAGKTIQDAIDEVREAVDFLRYYPQQAIANLSSEQVFTSYQGEKNRLKHQGRGVFVCISLGISRWRFLSGRLPPHWLRAIP